ncbi:dihydroneopterin aldolase [Sandarakinorhabdus sp.]|uniref:dihydroneopterin aldolase n=1 Tax=Sandarakinorhabdus sp. TaxID=1916663 RepID=UPI00286DF9D9|nr:dihydroneopterin aldolase [Sandarakinorhabdus sp.]
MNSELQLWVRDVEVPVLTGIYSEETGQTQPLRISVWADIAAEPLFTADTPLNASRNYLDIKAAITAVSTDGVHYMLVESVADTIINRLLALESRFTRVRVEVLKMAICEAGEGIGITLTRSRGTQGRDKDDRG